MPRLGTIGLLPLHRRFVEFSRQVGLSLRQLSRCISIFCLARLVHKPSLCPSDLMTMDAMTQSRSELYHVVFLQLFHISIPELLPIYNHAEVKEASSFTSQR